MKKLKKKPTGRARAPIPSDVAVFTTACWILAALLLSPLFGIDWFAPGDFGYSTAMYYHALMVPVLILLYLLAVDVLSLRSAVGRAFPVGAILALVFVGVGSVFNADKGVSVATVGQVVGMVMTDCLGIVLVVAMVKRVPGKDGKAGKESAAFWLLLTSFLTILIASALGHLAGWSIDMGPRSIPGLQALLNADGVKPADFQEGLTASHSHLIAAALMSGLAAVAAIFLEYRSRDRVRRSLCGLGLRTALVSLSAVAVIYLFSAIIGWEPPVLFASGPNGIPLDDVVLTIQGIGFLILMAGLSGSLKSPDAKPFSAARKEIRIGVFVNWICGFTGVVIPGVYIELHEGFYGAGQAPALGALSDNIFIRAHMLYPFLLLPIILAVTLAVGCAYDRTTARRSLSKVFLRTSVFGMLSGLAGEIAWFSTGEKQIFVFSVIVMLIALVAGMISLWPNAHARCSQAGGAR